MDLVKRGERSGRGRETIQRRVILGASLSASALRCAALR